MRKSVSKKSFQGREAMSMFSFGVIFVSLVFNTGIAFVLCFVEFSQSVHQVSSRNYNVFQRLFLSFIAL